MKKVIIKGITACLGLIFLYMLSIMCEGNLNSEDNIVNDYKKACELGEIEKAYAIVEDMKIEMQEYENENKKDIEDGKDSARTWRVPRKKFAKFTNLKSNYEEALHYVVLYESTKLLEDNGVEGLTRIAFIVKEHNAPWVYGDLLDLAKAMGDDVLVERLEKLAEDNKKPSQKP